MPATPESVGIAVSALVATVDRQAEILRLFMDGMRPLDIAEHLSCHLATVYRAIKEARSELLRTKKEHFDERAALMLDGLFNMLESYETVLSDPKNLLGLNHEQLTALQTGYGIFADKCFLLLAAGGARGGARQPTLQPGQGNHQEPNPAG